jgi:DNA-binding transcriptional regulator LsrR (DeoR family)
VSKLISKAKEHNIITIQINDPYSEENKFAACLKERYRLANTVVVNAHGLGHAEALELLARNISVLLSNYISNGNLVGVSAGYTIAACSAHATIHNCKDLTLVPLIARETSSGDRWSANGNCCRFAKRLDAGYFVLNAPMVIRQPDVREELKRNEAVKPVFDAYERLDVIVLGIGQAHPDSTLGKCEISRSEIVQAYEHGAKAIIGASFIDAGGNEVLAPLSDIFFGVKGRQILKCKSVIGVARGLEKVEAIKATLKGEYLHALCTDLETARALLT